MNKDRFLHNFTNIRICLESEIKTFKYPYRIESVYWVFIKCVS